MSLLLSVIRAAHCRSSHHKLALDAVPHIRIEKALRWQSVFLRNHEAYFEGSKDPDKTFKDFTNHVLHVRTDYWGGAPKQARIWFDHTVSALKQRKWDIAAYNAGVMSHYITDPIMPLHTGQSEEETVIHRAMEWSVCQTYEPIWELAKKNGLPQVEPGMHEDWLAELITTGAEIANGYYEHLIAEYDFEAGTRTPPKGLNMVSRLIFAQLIGFAVVTLSRALERACQDASLEVEPPLALPSLDWFFAGLDVPIYWVLKGMENVREADLVRAQFREFQKTGKLERTLTEDVRKIRDVNRSQRLSNDSTHPQKTVIQESSPEKEPFHPDLDVSRRPLEPVAAPARSTSSQPTTDNSQPARAIKPKRSSRKRIRKALPLDAPIVKAPSIGPKTADRLVEAGIHTVDDLLNADPDEIAAQLQDSCSYMKAENIRLWQDQTRLVTQVAGLKGTHAQILVGARIHTARELAELEPEEIHSEVIEYLETPEGQNQIRERDHPDFKEVLRWSKFAREAEEVAETLPA